MANNISIKISADVQQALNGIQSVNQKLDSMLKTAENTKKSFMGLTAGFTVVTSAISTVISAVQKAVDAGAELIRTYSLQEQAERRLQTVLRATQNAVGMSASELFDLADSLSSVTAYSDQEIIAVEQMLAATRKISSEVMPEATKAVLDMAAATGDDAAGAAKDLAQALSDPAGEIESLKEKGIQLSKEQAENIKRVQEQNGVYEAQKLLLKEVAGTYGGMAEAIADTDTGKLKQISNVWQDIKEGLGEGLLNLIQPALDTLYERLSDISNLVDGINERRNFKETVESITVPGAANVDLSGYSLETLQAAMQGNRYNLARQGWLWSESSQRDANPFYQGMTEEEWRSSTMGGGRYTEADYLDYQALEEAILNAMIDIRREQINEKANAQSALSGITASLVPSSGFTGGAAMPLTAGFMQTPEQAVEFGAKFNDVSSFIESNKALSSSYQKDTIQNQIEQVQEYMSVVNESSKEYGYLSEILDSLQAELGVSDETIDSWEKYKEAVSELFSEIGSLTSSVSDFLGILADSAKDELDAVTEKWDEYFEDLDKKQEKQSDSLNAMLASGNISYSDYIDSMNAMDEERSKAEEQAADEEDAKRSEANEKARAAFQAEQANQVAQATMNAALSITEIWSKYGSNPVFAGVLTGISAAATAMQISTIAAQQYTPMAAGGITQGPTRTLLGEGNPHELVMPLTEGNLERFGLGGGSSNGVINISINIGAVYSKDALADEIFKGIERAQRTGALPKWRYAG